MIIAGQSVIVTGGGSGLGAATARTMAELGARVTVLDRNADAAERVASEISSLAVAADVTIEGDMIAALDAATDRHGVPRIVINCAGIGGAARVLGRDGPMDLGAFQKIVNVNLIGTFNVLRLSAQRMADMDSAEECRGVIINTASVAAFEGQIGQAAYAASKGGIVAMALPIAREFARFGIRVNTVAPGIFRTPLMDTLPPDAQTALAASITSPSRLGTPEEFAHTVRFLVENDYVNGEVIRLDAATRLQPK